MRKLSFVLGSEAVRVCVSAYNKVLEELGHVSNRQPVPDNVRRNITSAILELAESGVRDLEELTQGALARLPKTSRQREAAGGPSGQVALKSRRSA